MSLSARWTVNLPNVKHTEYRHARAYVIILPAELGNFADKVQIGSFLVSLWFNMDQAYVVPEGDRFPRRMHRLNSVFQTFTIRMEIHVTPRSMGVARVRPIEFGLGVVEGDKLFLSAMLDV